MKPGKNIVGQRVQALRLERGWSQSKLAAKCQLLGWDITRDVIASIELRRRCVTDIELPLLAKVLQARLTDLYPRK